MSKSIIKMEESLNSSKPLFSISPLSKSVVFNMSKVIGILSFLTIISFYLNLILGCAYVFTCQRFTPSPHYLGSFLGYNRFYVMSFVLLTITSAFMYLGIYLELHLKSNNYERFVLKGVGVVTCIALPVVSLTNEMNSTHFLPFPLINSLLSYFALGFNGVWLSVLYGKYSRIVNNKHVVKRCYYLFIAIVVNGVVVGIQRHWNYQTENWFINTTF